VTDEAEVIYHKTTLSTRQYRLSLAFGLSLLLVPLAISLSPVPYPSGILWAVPAPIGLIWTYITVQLDRLYVDENGNLHPRKLRVEERDES